jgi:hypothetical protein
VKTKTAGIIGGLWAYITLASTEKERISLLVFCSVTTILEMSYSMAKFISGSELFLSSVKTTAKQHVTHKPVIPYDKL